MRHLRERDARQVVNVAEQHSAGRDVDEVGHGDAGHAIVHPIGTLELWPVISRAHLIQGLNTGHFERARERVIDEEQGAVEVWTRLVEVYICRVLN
jgi:hypothetical protein